MTKNTCMSFHERKELFLKWTQYLFYIQIGVLGVSIIGELPILDNVVMWIGKLFAIASVYVLYQLAVVHNRYKKAAIWGCIAIVLNILFVFLSNELVALAASICDLLFTYQEYSGHSDMMNGVDEKLSRNWHSLFNWGVIVGVLMGGISPVIIIVGVLANVEANTIADMVVGVLGIVNLVLQVVYIYFLYRMRNSYVTYEPVVIEESENVADVIE